MKFSFSPVLLPVAHLRQRATGECLAACAAMVFQYLSVSVDYQRLVRLLRIQPSVGTPFYNIRELRKLGISVVYRQGTFAELHTFLAAGLPYIAGVRTGQLPYWNGVDTHHAVVVVGMDSDYTYLNDPELATAPMQVSLGDFDLAWLEQDEYYAVLAP